MPHFRSLATLLVLVSVTALALEAQSAAQTRRLRANGTELSYVEQGSGTPVVFVHGAVADLRYWEPQREAVAKRNRFVAYTFRYHGTAPWTDEGKQYSAATHAADLGAFIGGLKSGPVHLVGLSYGGLLAALVAVKQPALIRTLTLAEPALFGILADLPEGKPALESWTKGTAPIIAAIKQGDAVQATKLLSAVVNGEPVENFEKLPPALRQMLLDNARTLPVLFAAPPESVTCDALRTIKAPTLLIRGANTPLIFSKTNEVVARCIPGSESIAIPEASHVMSYQNPQRFNQAVLDFIRRVRS